ncbi:unnamed protein product [marine sediment metagenome]|uniref:DUF5131 family protein n=1 Tax=marine sediment metagenome TaxID=412755 RepID=X0WLH1_9ZZZZ
MDKLEGVDEKAILMKEWELYEPAKLKKPSKIFVCSTIELFHPEVKFNTGAIFNVIKENPQHTFQILTKFPQNIDRPMPNNVWLGITITGNNHEDFLRASEFGFRKRKAKIQFVSYEPLFEEPVQNIPHVDWIIIGRLTGHGKRFDPRLEWIKKIVRSCADNGTRVFLKNNLKEIWGEPLIQEFPDRCQKLLSTEED